MSITRAELDAGRVDFAGLIDHAASALAPSSPGGLLREEWLGPLGLTAYRLAKDIGVPPNRMNGIINGTRAITADTALRLARYFATDAQSWMNLQTRYDLAVEAQAHGAEIAAKVRPREVA